MADETCNVAARIPSAKADAIHRALLTGLLSNIGHKTELHEYTGARGSKFNLFPASTLFKTKPPWVMSAEMVETTRLYARSVARIQPEWAERAGEHLVKRSYSDPHWSRQTAHVVAYEKVTLYGLPLIPRRTVHYGPIDPKLSREIFIQYALVEGDYDTSAPFVRHNQRLIDEIQTLEAKSRRTGILADTQARFDFYDRKIPANIHNGPAFEKWRRAVEQKNPKFLFMSRHDLLAGASGHVTQDLFPDAIVVTGINIPLEYHFEPGHPADGVTAAVPMASLNQLPAARFEWLVPGLLKEKITALIKSLPKTLRVNFIPAPDYAQEAFASLKPDDQTSLLDGLATFLGKKSGVRVPPGTFDPASLLDHLHMNFKVMDEAGKVVATGRDLGEIRKKLGVQLKASFEQLPRSPFVRDNVTRWDFGDLPDHVEVRRHGITLPAYPALIDADETAALRLFDTPESAAAAHRRGLRRLFMLQVKPDLQYIARNIANADQMFLYYATLGSPTDLKNHIQAATADLALARAGREHLPRTQEEFAAFAAAAYQTLNPAGAQIVQIAAQTLAEYHAVMTTISKPFAPLLLPAIDDVKHHLARLLPKDFLIVTPPAWLPHLPRFLQAIAVRLRKLTNAGLNRDLANVEIVAPLEQRYLDRRAKKLEAGEPEGTAMETYRWLLEEFRVSLFAQELKTSVPVSVKRLEQQWAAAISS